MNKKNIKSPTGNKLNCKGWHQEAAYRMLQNNLDPDVAEDPNNLIVYGGLGKAARDWSSYDKIISSLKKLENDLFLPVNRKYSTVKRYHRLLYAKQISSPPLYADWE